MPEMSEEQRKELMEKLRNMSPEELREFQKKQCIFCQILAGKIPSKKIYEDDRCFALLDINPAVAGHIILLPKEHYAIMPQMPEEEAAHIGIVSKHLSLALLKAMKAKGTTIFVANGVVAGQRAQHVMVHIIPRNDGDSLNLTIPQRQLKDEDLESVHNAIQSRVDAIFNIKRETVKVKPKVEEAQVKDAPKEEPEEEIPPKKEKKITKKSPKRTQTKEPQKQKKSKAGSASLDDIAELFS